MPLSFMYVTLSKLHWAFITAVGVTNVSARLSSIIKNTSGKACSPCVPVRIIVSYQVCARLVSAVCRIVVLLWLCSGPTIWCRSLKHMRLCIHVMNTSKSSSLLYVGIGMPMAMVFRYAYVPKVMGIHCSTSWAVSEIALFIWSLNALLRFSDLSLPSICPCEGFRSLQGVSISLQLYPVGVLGRLTGGLSPSLSGLALSSAPGRSSGSGLSSGLSLFGSHHLPPPPPPPPPLPPGSGL